MEELVFKAEDFSQQCADFKMNLRQIADEANARLQEMLKEALVVYGNTSELDWTMKPLPAGLHISHTARLVDIREIK